MTEPVSPERPLDTRHYQIDNMEYMGGDYFRPDAFDVRYSIVMLTFVVYIWWKYGIWFGLASFVTFMLSMMRDYDGRAYYRIGLWFGNQWIKFRNGIVWQTSKFRPTAPLGGLTIHGIQSIGLIHQRGSDTFLIEADGWAFPSQGIERQYGSIHDLSTTVRRLAASDDRFKIGVSPIFARLPPDKYRFAEHLGSGVFKPILRPDPGTMSKPSQELTPQEQRRLNLRRLSTGQIGIVAAASFRPRMLLAITVKHSGILAAALKTRSVAERQVDRLPVISMVYEAITSLQQIGVVNPRVLNSGELKEYLRSALDVVHIGKHYDARSDDRAADVDTYAKETPPAMSEGRNERHWRPQNRIWTDGETLVIDDTYIAVIELTEMPRLSHPNQLAALDAPDPNKVPYFIRCFLSQTMRSTREEQTVSISDSMIADIHEWYGSDQSKGRSAKKARERDRRLELMVESGFTQQSIPVYVILAPSQDDLERAVVAVKNHCKFNHVGPRRVQGEKNLVRMTLAAITGIPI